jgi:hypothetical protein
VEAKDLITTKIIALLASLACVQSTGKPGRGNDIKMQIKEDNKYCAKQIKYDYKIYFYSLNS